MRERLLLRRVVVLDGPLDDDNGALLATQLLTLAAEDPRADIALWIRSPGGSVPSMLAIRDVMNLVPCEVSTLALGLACSAGDRGYGSTRPATARSAGKKRRMYSAASANPRRS